MDVDFTWKNFSEAQAAAFEYAIAYAEPYLRKNTGITEFHVAEMMCTAEYSLWYTQAKSWAEGKSYPAKGADEVWQMAGQAIVKLVGVGYQDGQWWDMRKAWPSAGAAAMNLLAIIEAVRMLRLVRGKSLAIHSQGFEMLPYLMLPGLNVEKTIKVLGSGDQRKIAGVLLAIAKQYEEMNDATN